MYAIKGFKVKKCSLKKAESILNEAKRKASQLAQKRYNELLSREIEVYIDDLVLNGASKPEDSIFMKGKEILDRKIAVAITRKDNNEYNLACSVNLLSYENDTYIELCSVNEMYDDIFNNIEGVENYCVEEQDPAIGAVDEKFEVWRKIIEKYRMDSVLNMRVFPVSNNKLPTFEDLHFNTVEMRAETRARHHVTNVLLAGYASGEQIPPHKLMEYMDYALLRSTDAVFSRALKDEKEKIMRILPEITEELIGM